MLVAASGWLALAAGGCLPPADLGQEMQIGESAGEGEIYAADPAALMASNTAGTNLGGTNLGGTNLGGANLGGANLGGTNLGGANLGGANLGGTNLGGNNLGGNNLGGTNLGGSNLGGSNLGGSNLGGSNLGGSNLGGSNVAGTNLGGNNIAGTNLGGSNLGGSNTGRNIHNLTASINGMLYSGEDLWSAKTARCTVLGIGSTAFPKLLGQQSTNARIYVALGKLPWGFASTSGGSVALDAWEAVVWGDKTYCVFVMAAPPGTSWPGMAGFLKAVFRWNAPVSQTMEVSGIEASAAHDPTVSTAITTYTGMMNASATLRAGRILETVFVAGELAFVAATTNNQSVMVDFASWVLGKDETGSIVLGNVQSSSPPTHAEALYMALDNGDGTVSVVLDDAASHTTVMPAGMINSVVELNAAYLDWQAGRAAAKPVPRRCGGAMFLNTWYGEPVPAGKCDDGLLWAPGFCARSASPWSTVAGTTAPMNSYMQLTVPTRNYRRGFIANDTCGVLKEVLSETYVHMWEKSFDVAGTPATCVPETNAAFCARLGQNCGAPTATDNCGQTRTSASCGSCASPNTCGGGGVPGMCGNGVKTYEAEAAGNTLSGATAINNCAQAQMKFGRQRDLRRAQGRTAAGGNKVGFIGKNTSNYVTINNVNVPTAGTYNLTVFGISGELRTFYVSVNGGSAKTVNLSGPDWHRTITGTTTVSLKAGNNSLKFYNNSAYAPDLDRIMISTLSSPPPAPPPPATNCAFAVTQNVYAYASWWGTITVKNQGASTVTGYKVQFDVPAGVNCTADAVPSGATLSPLTGSGTSARTVSNHCVFTWPSASLAAGASRTFNYSTNSQSFNAAINVVAGNLSCL